MPHAHACIGTPRTHAHARRRAACNFIAAAVKMASEVRVPQEPAETAESAGTTPQGVLTAAP